MTDPVASPVGGAQLPIVACVLDRADLAGQTARWSELWHSAGIERALVDDGLRVSFRDEPPVARELDALVAVERQCCGWADWQVVAEGRTLILRATASGEGIAVLHSFLGGDTHDAAPERS